VTGCKVQRPKVPKKKRAENRREWGGKNWENRKEVEKGTKACVDEKEPSERTPSGGIWGRRKRHGNRPREKQEKKCKILGSSCPLSKKGKKGEGEISLRP